jgi:methionyl-tRNA formyltransferase
MSSFFVQLLGMRAKLLEEPIQRLGCRTEIIAEPSQVSPEADICLGWGVHYIIKKQFLYVPRLGIWGFHETALPEGRGCAPLQWTVLNGVKKVTMSFFQMVEKVDTGPLLGQDSFDLTCTDLLDDMRDKSRDVVLRLLDSYLVPYLQGAITPYEQQGESSYYRKRTLQDSRLDLQKPLSEQWDLIRVCDNEAYPAWFELNGQKIILKRYKATA